MKKKAIILRKRADKAGNHMKYFCTETERKASKSTCYFEFQKGRHKGKHWLQVKSRAEAVGGEALDAVMEIEDWVVKCFKEKEVFTICGI